MAEHIPQAGISQQLDQQQVLAFLQGKCAFQVNFYTLNACIFSKIDWALCHIAHTGFLLNISLEFFFLLPCCHREV